MPRPSRRAERRRELVEAFEVVLGEHGYQGATVARLADAAELSPGLVHHYFRDKEELVEALLAHLVDKLRERIRDVGSVGELTDAVLKLDASADPVAAKAWVGVLAESMRREELRRRVRWALGRLDRALRRVGASDDEATAQLALLTGFLILGAVDPERTDGRAAALARRVHLD